MTARASTASRRRDEVALNRVGAVLRREPPAADLSTELLARMAEVVPFDLACWGLLDPLGHLPLTNNSTVPGGAMARAAWQSELTVPDIYTVRELISMPSHVGVLSSATGGEPERSRRYRVVLEPAGVTDELRAVLCVGGVGWGWLALFRFGGTFVAADADRVANLARPLARAWRTALLNGSAAGEPAAGPAVLVVNGEGELDSMTPGGQLLLDQLPPGSFGPVSDVLHALAIRVRAESPRSVPRAAVRGARGHWLALEAAPLLGSDHRVAISITQAAGSELAAVLLGGYELTARETEVALAVLRHETSAQIAAALHLSRWTVQDHVKAVFAKTGVRSRQDLAVQLFATRTRV